MPVIEDSPKRTAPLHPAVPPDGMILPGGWFCVKSAVADELSHCVKTADECELVRKASFEIGLHYGECRPQRRAACVTFHNVKKGRSSYDCSATNADCERKRAKTVQQAYTTDLADCTLWE